MSDDIKVQLLKAFEWSNDTMLEKAHDRIEELEAKLNKAIWELEILGFDFESVIGRELMGVDEEEDEDD